MSRDARYDVLFEPVPIGPVTARNRFFQVPHCNGMGHRDPQALAAMRGVKAEGGWAVVSTEEVEIHPSSELTPYVEGRLWDDADIPAHALVVSEIHRHGALAAIELVHSGLVSPNHHTRVPPMGPGHQALGGGSLAPIQSRRMSESDIADLRQWHRAAVARSLEAGYDIVYVYAGHGLTTLQHFLSPRTNKRTDGYGGSAANRARLLREVLEDTLEVASGRAAVACRLAVDELAGADGYRRSDIETLLAEIGELPDLWDFTIGEWDDDSVTSRFGPEGGQEEHIRGLKELTSKPVVGVGRFTSPDTMAQMVRRGVLDFVGAARPSIADPFLPRKIEEGRIEEIRECIGCNVCVTGDFTSSPIRCTQNPAMGEEWRRGWHPERFAPSERPGRVLVVGGGPAGLEAAVTAARRGHEVALIERTRELGGRVRSEARLPGLAEWIRVRDYRVGRLAELPGASYYLESELTADEVLDYGFEHVAIATGAVWRRDGVGRWHHEAIEGITIPVLTPDDIFAGARPEGERVALFDDDHYYLGGALAELLIAEGYSVALITPASDVSAWTHNTMEQHRIQARLLELGVEIHTNEVVVAGNGAGIRTASTYTDRPRTVACDAAVFVTSRLPNEQLALDLEERRAAWSDAGLATVRTVGDAHAPGTIASAVWDGRRFSEDLEGASDAALFRRNVPALTPDP